jgi:hypothetical protein
MTISHDPNHSPGAGLVLSEGAEETAEATVAGKVPSTQASRSRTGFWAGIVMVLFGVATLGAGLIFFSVQPGLLSLEGMGSGLGLLVLCLLLVVGARRLIEAPPEEEPAWTEAALEPSAVSAPSEPPMLPIVPPPVLPESTPAVPPDASAPEAAPGVPVERAAPTPASGMPPEAAEEAPPAPAVPKQEPAHQPARNMREAITRNGHARGESLPPRPVEHVEASAPEAVPRPSLANLPERFHLSATHAVIDEEVDDLGDLLGRVAEQGALLMTAKGRRGAARRANLANKIEQFQQEMARDPDYAPIADFFACMAALLRAGTLVPPVKPLEDPFDGLYQYVLTLVRRRM